MKKKYLILSFILPIIIITMIYAFKGVVPFGNKSIVVFDGPQQYLPMTFGIFKNNISFFKVGIGGSVVSIFFTYLSSPFNLLVLLFNHNHMDLFFSILFMLKIACASLTMNIYLSKKHEENSYNFVALSVVYSLCGYVQCYGFNFMWLDVFVLLPIIILGIERFYDKNNYKLYIIMVLLLIFSNYYMSYMVIIFSGVYAFFYFIKDIKLKEFKMSLIKYIKFVAITTLCIISMAFVIYPLLKNASGNSSMELVYINNYIFKTNKKAFFLSHFSFFKNPSIVLTDLVYPAFSCGILIIYLFICFFFNKKINSKDKFFYLTITLFLLLCFFEFAFDHLMNCFHIPNSLPYRYSFLYSFILISISSYGIKNYKKLDIKYKIIPIVIIEIILLIFIKSLTLKIVIVNTILLFLYLLFIKKFNILILLLVIIEIFFTFSNNIVISNVNKFNDDYKKNLVENKTINRIEIQNIKKNLNNNNSLLYNYYGLDSFSSTNNKRVYEFLYNFGFNGNNYNSIQYDKNDESPFLNILFNVDYVIDNNNIKENQYKSSYMIGMNKKIKNFTITGSLIKNQSMFSKYLIEENILEKNNYEIKLIEEKENFYLYEVIISEDSYLMDYPSNFVFLKDNENIVYKNNAFEIFSIKGKSYLQFNEFNILKLDKKILFSTYGELKEDLNIYKYVNIDKFYDEIKDNLLENVTIKGNTLEGDFDLKEDKTIFTSIAYDEGLTLYVDGKKHDYYAFNDALLMFDLESGKHHIKLVYKEINFIKGLIISSITILCILLSYIFYKKSIKVHKNMVKLVNK